MSTRRELAGGGRTIASLLCALPISTCMSIGIATMEGISKDGAISIGFYLWAPAWVWCACAIFVAERPARTGAILGAMGVLLCALGRIF